MGALCVMQDLDAVLEKVRTGTPLDDILKPPQPVASHVLDDFSDGEDADVSERPASGHTAGISEARPMHAFSKNGAAFQPLCYKTILTRHLSRQPAMPAHYLVNCCLQLVRACSCVSETSLL